MPRAGGRCLFSGRQRTRLGELELRVLDRLWEAGPAEVKSVHEAVGTPRGISPKTVHSALERLVRKGLAERRRLGRAYQYRATLSRREWIARSVQALSREVPGTSAETLLAAFVDLAEREGADRLAELECLVRERRRRARKGPH